MDTQTSQEDLVDKALQVWLGKKLESETMRLWDAFSNTKKNYGIIQPPPKKNKNTYIYIYLYM